MNPEITKILEKLGLNDKEVAIYLALLQTGTTAASVLGKKTGMPRSTARFTCDQLIKKGLCTSVQKGNTFLFSPESPDKLMYFVEQKKKDVVREEDAVNRIIGDLKKMANPYSVLPKVRFFEGIEGVQNLFNKMIETPSNLVSFGAGDYFLDQVPELIQKFRDKAYKQYKNIKVIRAPKYKSKHKKDIREMETKYFLEIDELKVDIQITENKVSIASVSQNSPMGILIVNREIADAFQQIFNELWKKLD